MLSLNKGIQTFEKHIFPKKAGLFNTLANGQNPSVLMITCADSRIMPSLITQSEPGEVFVCRNAGNVVPPAGSGCDGTVASIEFAIASFDIDTIVVCGHSDCGAMKGVQDPTLAEGLPTVANWLQHSCKGEGHADLKSLTIENIRHQINHLLTYPAIKCKVDDGQIDIVGWYYDIGQGQVISV